MMQYPSDVWRAVVGRMTESAGLSVNALAGAAGVDQSGVHKFLNGRTDALHLDTLLFLAEAARWDRERLCLEVEMANAQAQAEHKIAA